MNCIRAFFKLIICLVVLVSNYGCDSSPVGPGSNESDTSLGHIAINSNGDIFASIGGEDMFRSTDNGDTWTQVNTGLSGLHVWALAINRTGDIFASIGGNGMVRSVDNGETWSQINTGLTDTAFTSIAFRSDDAIFIGTTRQGRGVFRSTDNGDTWTQSGSIPAKGWPIRTLAINNTGAIFAGTNIGMFRSINSGENWRSINTGFEIRLPPPDPTPRAPIPPSFCLLSCSAIAINDSGDVIRGTDCDGVYRSTDNGETWRKSAGMESSAVVALAVSSNGNIFAGTSVGAFRSTDHGDSWRLTLSTDRWVKDFAIGNNDHIYALTSVRVYRSTDNGDTWTFLQFP